MVKSLESICINNLSKQNLKRINELLPYTLHQKYIEYLQENNFNQWKNKISLVNLELNIKDMQVNQDMYFDELTYHIFIKKKYYEDDEFEEEEYILFHEYWENYDIYDKYMIS